jgi:UDP-2,3-diacylglucosamine pyrophosphatase LpxH
VRYAGQHEAQGVICGHIHTPRIARMGDIDYYNSGDWVESGTALVERWDGRIELVRWLEEGGSQPESSERRRVRLRLRRSRAA